MSRCASAGPVSVVLPVFDGERFLAEAIESVLTQTHQDLELIVVDDGSADASTAIATIFAACDPRVRLLRQPNRGVSAARNRALAEAHGEWIAFLDADDAMLPERIERQLAFAAAHPTVDLVGTHATLINADGKPFGTTFPAPARTDAEFDAWRASGHTINICQSTWLARRHALRNVGGYREDLCMAEDVDLLQRLADSGGRILFMEEPLTRYRIHPGSTMMRRAGEVASIGKYVEACSKARRRGAPEPELARWRAAWLQQSALRRLLCTRGHLGYILQRVAGTYMVNGSLLCGLPLLALAAVLTPHRTLRRFAAQLRHLRGA